MKRSNQILTQVAYELSEPDLFGFVAPSRPKKIWCKSSSTKIVDDEEIDREKITSVLEEALAELCDEVSYLIDNVQMEVVSLVNDENSGEIDGLLETLDEELTGLIRSVRRKLLW